MEQLGVVSGSPCTGTGATTSVFTTIEGGDVEIQKVRLNVPSGYIDGDYFTLTLSKGGLTETTNPMSFGVDASVLQSELLGFTSLSYEGAETNHVTKMITVTNIAGSGTVFTCQESIFGVLNIHDIVKVSNSVLRITAMNGFTFTAETISGSPLSNSSSSHDLFKYHAEAVQVVRSGTGNSTATKISLVSTANAFVPKNGDDQFFNLRMTVNGVTKTSRCIPYHATASEVQDFINLMGFDFNNDAASNTGDHVVVTRDGDGTSASGFGYTYYFTFSGPLYVPGKSTVMGASNPTVEVINAGSGVCRDLTLSRTALTIQVFKNSFLNISNSLFSETTLVSTTSTEGRLQAGDRIEIETSTGVFSRTYIVTQTGMMTNRPSDTFTIDFPIDWSNDNSIDTFKVHVIKGGLPQFSTELLVEGEDSFAYEIFFTGRHLSASDVPDITATLTDSFKQYGGMVFGLDTEIVQKGGSYQELTIDFTSSTPMPLSESKEYFKLVYIPTEEVSAPLTWGSNYSHTFEKFKSFFSSIYIEYSL
jgi:hypothetical protein